jgi:hypothetical protein
VVFVCWSNEAESYSIKKPSPIADKIDNSAGTPAQTAEPGEHGTDHGYFVDVFLPEIFRHELCLQYQQTALTVSYCWIFSISLPQQQRGF